MKYWLFICTAPLYLLVAEVASASSVCVYNHAYQENYEADTAENILASARGCYVLVDPYELGTPTTTIATIKGKGNQVGCYISVGTGEKWRSDFKVMKPALAKKEWSDWPGEYYVNRITTSLTDAMKKRINRLDSWGCDYVEFDNMDWATDEATRKKYKLELTETEAKNYVRQLCDAVHQAGMKCMAKSSTLRLATFDGLTVESYPKEKNWWETAEMKGVLAKSGIGLVVHYGEKKCDSVRQWYQKKYGTNLSFICEDAKTKQYKHY